MDKLKICDSFVDNTPVKGGYSLWTAAVFMTSFNAGLGLLALPHSIAGTGWYGLFLILIAVINSTYSAVALGQTWLSMESKWQEYRGKFRYPYPAMGMRAVGPWMRYVVTAALHMSAVGMAVVYLLLSAQVAQSMTETFFAFDYKYWIIILAAVLCPLTWFGSIEKFKFAGIGALVTIVLACLLILVATILDADKAHTAKYEEPSFMSASLSFGSILFAFGGIFFYPTVQNDMKNKRQFDKAVLLSFSVLLFMYAPVAIVGYLVYGSNVASNILLSFNEGSLKTVINICLAIHTFLAFLLGINPVLQEVEEALHIPADFNWKRCLARTIIVGIALVIAYTIPHFSKVLNLIGGSSITMLTFICPAIFYFMIQDKEVKLKETKKKFCVLEKIFMLQIILVGVAGGFSCTYFAVIDIAQTFEPNYHETIRNRTLLQMNSTTG